MIFATGRVVPQPQDRTTFTLLEMIHALRGFRTDQGVMVIPNAVAEKIEDEIRRLYEVEETAVALAYDITSNDATRPSRDHPLIVAILGEPDNAD
ncbi:MAG: hypothetical protein DHS20C20_30740 [Ardenticatenaceae bacterium]|nr:MAG: hypothetical protein DHS20C20_30740 [Ardenticatenaceae bacterium]